ncbi:MAG: hypothetical protein ACR2IV_18155, partial [Bryobacteraceae bacterium]
NPIIDFLHALIDFIVIRPLAVLLVLFVVDLRINSVTFPLELLQASVMFSSGNISMHSSARIERTPPGVGSLPVGRKTGTGHLGQFCRSFKEHRIQIRRSPPLSFNGRRSYQPSPDPLLTSPPWREDHERDHGSPQCQKLDGVPVYQIPKEHKYGQHSLFDGSLADLPPLDLAADLITNFAGKTVEFQQLLIRHSPGTPYVERNYKDALAYLVDSGKIACEPSTQFRQGKRIWPKNMRITFPAAS